MALKRLVIDGFGQLELNQVAFRRDGRIEAQCHIDSEIPFIENGMILAIDKAGRKVGYPKGEAHELLALNYTSEHMYDERHDQLKDFRLENNSFLPRLGFLSIGDRFTTNCLAYDSDEFADEDALKEAAEGLFGVPCENGAIKLTADPEDAKIVLKVAKVYSMPDGQFGIKFVVVAA